MITNISPAIFTSKFSWTSLRFVLSGIDCLHFPPYPFSGNTYDNWNTFNFKLKPRFCDLLMIFFSHLAFFPTHNSLWVTAMMKSLSGIRELRMIYAPYCLYNMHLGSLYYLEDFLPHKVEEERKETSPGVSCMSLYVMVIRLSSSQWR